MSAPYNPNIDLQVGRGHGLHLQINGRPVPDSYGAIVMAELAQLCDFPDVDALVGSLRLRALAHHHPRRPRGLRRQRRWAR